MEKCIGSLLCHSVHVAALVARVRLVRIPLESLEISWEEFATCWT